MSLGSQLCNACQRIFELPLEVENPLSDTYRNGRDNTHHNQARSCQTASVDGCPICHVVWTQATTEDSETDILSLPLKTAFSTFTLKVSREEEDTHRSHRVGERHGWKLNISIGSVGRAQGKSDQYVLIRNQVPFAITPVDGENYDNHKSV